MGDSKHILGDKIKLSSAIIIFLLLIFAFFLLVQYDIGTFFRLNRVTTEAIQSRKMLESTLQYKEYIDQFDSRFAMTGETSRLMEILADLSRKDGIALESIKPAETYSASAYQIARIVASGNASYSALLRFLASVEDFKKFIYIERLILEEGAMPLTTTRFPLRGIRPISSYSQTRADNDLVKFSLTIAAPVR